MDITNKAIAITGASSGIGRATAIAAARAGMRVAVGGRRLDRLREVAAEIEGVGGRAIAIACDVSKQEECERFVAEASREFSGLHAVFANAGLAYEAPFLQTTDAMWEETLRTNFWGSVWIARAALPQMLARGSGHVLMCSSCLSKMGTPRYAAYSMSKAMQDHACRALRHELSGTGVCVSSVHPIGTRTELFDETKKRSQDAKMLLTTSDRLMQGPQRVADAVMACLRKPRGEVWTSLPTRLAMGAGVALPGVMDWVVGRAMSRRAKNA